jgi:hypothetical protein
LNHSEDEPNSRPSTREQWCRQEWTCLFF